VDKLAIFDLDGTLFHTTRVNYLAYCQALEGIAPPPDYEFFRTECFGHDFGYFGALLAPNASVEQLKEIHRRKKACYADFLCAAKKNQPLFDLMHQLRSGYHTALVTVGSKENSGQILRYFDEVDSFDLIISSADITRPKPDPEGFLLAMKHFNVQPENTIIFEDSAAGIAAAKATGAGVFVVEGYR
jgi:beta-phosphoglucomutase